MSAGLAAGFVSELSVGRRLANLSYAGFLVAVWICLLCRACASLRVLVLSASVTWMARLAATRPMTRPRP